MSAFGTYVQSVLDEHNRTVPKEERLTSLWLAQQIGVAPQTVSAWKRRDTEPLPATVYKVALLFEREFGVPRERTAAAAGYPFRWSNNGHDQQTRMDALAAASPRFARNMERAAGLPARELDELMSFIEVFLARHGGRRTRRRKRPPESQ